MDLDEGHQQELQVPQEGGDLTVPLVPDDQRQDSGKEDLKHRQSAGGEQT